jgi:hypothetical protein
MKSFVGTRERLKRGQEEIVGEGRDGERHGEEKMKGRESFEDSGGKGTGQIC